MLVPVRGLLAQKVARGIRAIHLETLILGDQLASRIPANVVHQGSDGVDFQITVSKAGDLRCHDEAEDHGALDMIEGEVGGVSSGVFQRFGDKRGVGNGCTSKNASRDGAGHGFSGIKYCSTRFGFRVFGYGQGIVNPRLRSAW